MIKILLAILGAYLLVLVLTFVFQGRMVFFPDSQMVGTPASFGLAYEDVQLRASDGVELHGWFVPGPGGGATALFCHGNAGNISHRLEMLEVIHRLGLSCLMFDYRGYGKSQGSPSEQGLYRDAQAAWDWLLQDKGADPERIICWGRSLGGPIAARLARDNQPGALIIESTFTSLPDLGQKLYPFLPVSLISRLRFPTVKYVRKLTCPLLVVHSTEDEIVPFAFGEKLYQAAPDPKQFLPIRGGHNEGFAVSGQAYVRGVQEFLWDGGLISDAGRPEGRGWRVEDAE